MIGKREAIEKKLVECYHLVNEAHHARVAEETGSAGSVNSWFNAGGGFGLED